MASIRLLSVLVIGMLTLVHEGTSRAQQAAWSGDRHVGVVAAVAGTPCLIARGRSLPARTRVHIVDTESQEPRAAVVVRASDGCLERGLSHAGLRGYIILFDGPAPEKPVLGIGVFGATPVFRRVEGSTVADLDGDGRDEYFRKCTSSEGVHLTVWSGAPLTGVRRWHAYHYLSYDVIPTCTEPETRAPSR